jgi:hypothetical protein
MNNQWSRHKVKREERKKERVEEEREREGMLYYVHESRRSNRRDLCVTYARVTSTNMTRLL